MSGEVSWIFEITLKPGAADGFRALAREMVDANRAEEPDTLHYQAFITEDGARVHWYERFRDPAAILFHVGRFGATYAARLLDMATVTRFDIYGDPGAEVRAVLADFGPTYLSPVAGFAR